MSSSDGPYEVLSFETIRFWKYQVVIELHAKMHEEITKI